MVLIILYLLQYKARGQNTLWLPLLSQMQFSSSGTGRRRLALMLSLLCFLIIKAVISCQTYTASGGNEARSTTRLKQ